jgi:hypothetical protein
MAGPINPRFAGVFRKGVTACLFASWLGGWGQEICSDSSRSLDRRGMLVDWILPRGIAMVSDVLFHAIEEIKTDDYASMPVVQAVIAAMDDLRRFFATQGATPEPKTIEELRKLMAKLERSQPIDQKRTSADRFPSHYLP